MFKGQATLQAPEVTFLFKINAKTFRRKVGNAM